MAEKGKPGRKRGGRNSVPTFKKPKGIKKITGKNTGNAGKRNLRAPWRKGESGNRKGRPKGSGTKDLHLVFQKMLEQKDKPDALMRMEELFLSLYKKAKSKGGTDGRTVLAWGVGMPPQMLKIHQAVELKVGIAEELDNIDLESLENVIVSGPRKEPRGA